ncbi:MAG: hypothetical protein ABH823_03980 [bacterium]
MRILGCFVLVLSLAIQVFAFGGPAPESSGGSAAPVAVVGSDVLILSDFESGNLRSPQEWWVFDISAQPVANSGLTGGDANVAGSVGNYSLSLKGPAKNWYAGGVGTYVAKENVDLSKYASLQIDVYGNGPGSGTLKIEVFDDDNNNWQAEQDPANNYMPIYDDKYVTDITVDWTGWKRLVLPFEDFVDDNAGVGDNVWNPEQAGGSGGLLQLQFICLGAKGDALVNFNVDNLALSVSEE